MLPLLMRGIKGQPLIKNDDLMNLKNYYSTNKAEVDKELDHIKKLNFKDQLWPILFKKLELIEKSHSKTFNFQ